MTQILIVDDEAQIRELLLSFLEEQGYKAHAADGGVSALEIAPRLKPKVILLDIKMPDLDGIETLKRLKTIAPDSTIIMMSGHADQETALKAMKMGAHDFIEKPFDLPYLERVLLVKMATG